MKTLMLILFFSDGSSLRINHTPLVSCETDARILNRPELLVMYEGGRVPDGRTIDHAKWECR